MEKWFYGLFAFVIAIVFLFAGPVITKPLFAGDELAGKSSKSKDTPDKTDAGEGRPCSPIHSFLVMQFRI